MQIPRLHSLCSLITDMQWNAQIEWEREGGDHCQMISRRQRAERMVIEIVIYLELGKIFGWHLCVYEILNEIKILIDLSMCMCVFICFFGSSSWLVFNQFNRLYHQWFCVFCCAVLWFPPRNVPTTPHIDGYCRRFHYLEWTSWVKEEQKLLVNLKHDDIEFLSQIFPWSSTYTHLHEILKKKHT